MGEINPPFRKATITCMGSIRLHMSVSQHCYGCSYTCALLHIHAHMNIYWYHVEHLLLLITQCNFKQLYLAKVRTRMIKSVWPEFVRRVGRSGTSEISRLICTSTASSAMTYILEELRIGTSVLMSHALLSI